MSSVPHLSGVYMVHFESKLSGHAQHYIGWSVDVFVRLTQHRRNQGARILEVCNERGIGYKLVRLWRGRNRSFERQLKNRKNARKLCPTCNPNGRKYPTKPKATAGKKPGKFLMHDGSECPF